MRATGEVTGSLRYCLEDVSSPKTIVFETSGTIDLDSEIVIGAHLGADAATKGSYITIAGQTAPSPGITIKDYGFKIERNCHDILIQHIRFRTGDNSLWDNYNDSWTDADGGGAGTVYYHTCTSTEGNLDRTAVEPVIYDGTELTEDDGQGASTALNGWDLDDDNDRLYVNVGGRPSKRGAGCYLL
jgi:hypothetical protein